MGVESSQVHSAGWSDGSANSRSFAAGFLWLASDLYFLLTRNLAFSLQASCVATASTVSWLAEWPATLTELQEQVSRLYLIVPRNLMFSASCVAAVDSTINCLAEWPPTLTQLQELDSCLYFLLVRHLVFLIQTTCGAVTAAIVVTWLALTQSQELSGGFCFLVVRDLVFSAHTWWTDDAVIILDAWLIVTESESQKLLGCLYFLLKGNQS